MALTRAFKETVQARIRGNPQARNLFEVIGQLQRIEGLHFELLLRAAS